MEPFGFHRLHGSHGGVPMKHIIAAVLLTVLAALGAYSFWSGMRAQQEFNDFVHTLGENPDVRVLSSDFRRGWVRSSGELDFEVHGEMGASFAGLLTALGAAEVRPRVGFRMRHDIEHGHDPLVSWVTSGMSSAPVMARVRSGIELDNESQAELASVLGRVPGIDLDTVVMASGVGESRIRMRAAQLRKVDAEHALQVDWKGLSGSMVWNEGFEGVRARVQSAGLSGRGQDVAMEATGFEWTLQTEPGADFFVGDVHASLATLQILDAKTGASRLLVEGFEIAQQSHVQGGAYGTDLTLALDELRYQQQGYGPGFLEIALGGIDAEALAQVRRVSARLQSAAADSAQADEVRNAAIAGELTALLPALLSRSPSLELKRLQLTTPEGVLRADAKASVAEGMAALANPLMLFAALEAEFAAQLPERMFSLVMESRARQVVASEAGEVEGDEAEAQIAEMRDALIAQLRSSGYVVCNAGVCRTRVMLRNGELTVNGIPFQGFGPQPAPEAAVSMLE